MVSREHTKEASTLNTINMWDRGKWLGSKEMARKVGVACAGRTRPSAFSTDPISAMLLFLVQGGKSFQKSHTLAQLLRSYCVCGFSKRPAASHQVTKTNKHKHVEGCYVPSIL